MARALAVETCWATTMRTSPPKPAGRRRSAGGPESATRFESRGSMSISRASARSKVG
jgi:hypothetical protein